MTLFEFCREPTPDNGLINGFSLVRYVNLTEE
jgi:hypothetical protein